MLHEGGIDGFLSNEVLPHAPDAWYAPASVKTGYEISFTRHFYQPQPMRPLEEIRADIMALERETEGLLGEIVGGNSRAATRDRTMLNEQDIQDLIRLPKSIVGKNPAKGYREGNGQRRCDLELESSDGTGRAFPVFIRQSIRLPGNFSIGLRYAVNRGKLTIVTLARYNGPHGEHSHTPDGHYALPHIHYITEAEIETGHSQPQENHRELTDRYANLEQALRVFFADTATRNYSDYFPELTQLRLINGY